ncbi:MAG: phosphoribosylanthranilate isomerase [Polaribacter sp.]|jgi:phosphoribosylanthranilate isomerase
MLKTNIFAGGITNLTDARYFAARGAQFLSFNLEQGATLGISSEKTAAIKEWVEGPSFIGVFQITPLEDIRFLVERLNLHMVQVGPFISLDDLRNNPIGIPLVREVIIEQLNDFSTLSNELETLSSFFDYILINFEKNGIAWSAIREDSTVFTMLKNWSADSKLILAIAHDPSETQEILDELNPNGLYLQGGEEEKVGFKSFDDLDEILDVVEEEEY